MRFRMLCGAAWAAALVLCAGCGEERAPADVVFLNGTIYTLRGAPPPSVEGEPRVEALAVRGGRILALGTSREMRRHRGRRTRVPLGIITRANLEVEF